MAWQAKNDFLTYQIIKFNSFSIKGCQIQIGFAQLVLFFVLPRNSRRKSFRELQVNWQLNSFQTATARNSYFRAQFPALLNLFTFASDTTFDIYRLDQTQLLLIKFKLVECVCP